MKKLTHEIFRSMLLYQVVQVGGLLMRHQKLQPVVCLRAQAGGIAAREFSKLLYGSESVYARVPEISTVNAISRDDLRAFHRQNFRFARFSLY